MIINSHTIWLQGYGSSGAPVLACGGVGLDSKFIGALSETLYCVAPVSFVRQIGF